MSYDKKEIKHISDFEWASVCQYVVWLSGYLGLHEIDGNRVASFRVGKGGLEGLLAKKQALKRMLEVNRAAMEVYVAEHRESISAEEMSVLRGVWKSFNDSLITTNEHIARAKVLIETQQMAFNQVYVPTEEEDLLF